MIVFDIETGPRPWKEIAEFYEPPAKLGEFDPADVKYGNTKDPAKREAKLREEQQKHAAAKASETVEHEAHRQKWLADAALSPITGRVLAIGVRVRMPNDEPSTSCNDKLMVDPQPEAEMLFHFWRLLDRARQMEQNVVGHNIHGFDLPFLVARSRYHDIPVPPIWDRGDHGRWFAPFLVDTMERWHCGRRNGYVSLDTLARFFGVGGKPDDVSGGDFARLLEEDRPKAMAYLQNDLEMTWRVAERLGIS